MPMFTSNACDIENSLVQDNSSGTSVGVVATASGASPLLNVELTSSSTSGGVFGQQVYTTLNPASGSSNNNLGLYSVVQTASNSVNYSGYTFGVESEVNHYGAGTSTMTGALGVAGLVANRSTGTITDAYGIYADVGNASTGTINYGYGVFVFPPSNSGTFSHYYGLYVGDPTAGGTISNPFGVYSVGGPNYFGGSVGIGTTTPAANLEVNGTAKLDNTVTVTGLAAGDCVQAGTGGLLTTTSYPCGIGGTGSITGVTAGTGLTGGGTSGNVTLNVGPTQIFSTSLMVGGTNQPSDVLEVQSTPGTDALTVNSSGTVGLGTGSGAHITTPSQNTDFAGTVTITSGSSGYRSFSGTGFGSKPVCVWTPTGNSYGGGTWWDNSSATQAVVNVTISGPYTFNYTCVGNPN